MSNPFDVNKQEGKYYSWNHGFESQNEDDNPYTDQSEPDLCAAWKQGFIANKKRKPKVKSVSTVDITGYETILTQENKTLSELPDEFLMAELKRRKQSEYDSLLQERDKIQKKLDKIKLLFEE